MVLDRLLPPKLDTVLSEEELINQSAALSPHSVSNGTVASLPTDPKAMVLYYVVMYSSLWASLLMVLFLFSQSYHCFYLPFVSPLSSLLTSAIWTARFQSLKCCVYVVTCVPFILVVWCGGSSGECGTGWLLRQWWNGKVSCGWEEKQRTVLLLAALAQDG